jgi:endoglucanase
VVVHGRQDLVGVMGSKPVHLMSDADKRRAPKLEDYVVDVGLSAERLRELVRPGDVVTRDRSLTRLGDLASTPRWRTTRSTPSPTSASPPWAGAPP